MFRQTHQYCPTTAKAAEETKTSALRRARASADNAMDTGPPFHRIARSTMSNARPGYGREPRWEIVRCRVRTPRCRKGSLGAESGAERGVLQRLRGMGRILRLSRIEKKTFYYKKYFIFNYSFSCYCDFRQIDF